MLSRKWRPTEHRAIYVIAEVHGNMNSLEVILNRILPLRKHKGKEDVVIFLGDYIDNDEQSNAVIDCLITIQQEYKDRAIFLKGNHEEVMLKGIYGSNDDFQYWVDNGGIATIKSYLDSEKSSASPYSITQNRILDIIPKEHIEFIRGLQNYYILDNYIFFHGGFNINKTIVENSMNNFIYDYVASKKVKDALHNKEVIEYKDNYIYIGAHNFNSNIPFISSRYMMLGGSAPGKLLVFELNSMTACAATRGKSRIYKYKFKVNE
jgi:hypothetical protein